MSETSPTPALRRPLRVSPGVKFVLPLVLCLGVFARTGGLHAGEEVGRGESTRSWK